MTKGTGSRDGIDEQDDEEEYYCLLLYRVDAGLKVRLEGAQGKCVLFDMKNFCYLN